MAVSDELNLLVPKVKALENDLAVAEARIAELESTTSEPAPEPAPEPTPEPAPVEPTFDVTLTTVGEVQAGQPIPVSAKITVSSGSYSNMIVNVEAQQNGQKISQDFLEGVTLSGTADIPLTLPAVSSGDYTLVLMVFDGPAPGTYAWGAERLREEVALTVPVVTPETAPVASTGLYKAPQQVDSYVASNPTLKTIADEAQGVWLVDRSATNTRAKVEGLVKDAAGEPLILVTYNLPGRDNGNYSAGGAASVAEYKTWIDAIVAGLGTAPAYIIIEPDALGLLDGLDATKTAERIDVLNYANTRLQTNQNARVYTDASHWVTPTEMASRLKQVSADGFSVNVSAYNSLTEMLNYSNELVAAGGVGWTFVIDTSRNGQATAGSEWCNPAGQGLGKKPTTSTGITNADAFLWIKAPGESDGTCNGGPSAGTFWVDKALELVNNAKF